MASDDTFVVVDLFAGAGGLSTGIARACQRLGLQPGVDVELHAVNHWEPAIETHRENHPWAHQYQSRIEQLHPPDLVEPGEVNLLAGGPECTHYSGARGGKPVSDQKRAPAWNVLTWIQQLRPDHLLLENVEEFRLWGPIDDDGTPSKDGTIFEQWIHVLETFGYTIAYDENDEPGVVLNAADYGDPQARKRLFIMGARDDRPERPTPTHGPETDRPRRTAAEVIDWSDLGTSLWTRDLENARVTPPAENTMKRIAEGIRRHCDEQFSPFAEIVESLTPDRLRELRELAVPLRDAPTVAAAVDDPFFVRVGERGWLTTPSIVKLFGTSSVQPVEKPLSTVTSGGNNHALSVPRTLLLGQQTNYAVRDVNERPVPTLTRGGKHALYSPETILLRQGGGGVPASVDDPLPTVQGDGAIATATASARPLIKPRDGPNGGLHSNLPYPAHDLPFHTVTAKNGNCGHLMQAYLTPLYSERSGQRPRTRRVDRPVPTVTRSKSPAGLVTVRTPLLDDFHGNSVPMPVDEPVRTIETKDRLALCIPELWPFGLDIKYRMLQPRELKQAQGFPDDYELVADTKRDQKKLIGNAVPVNTACEIVSALLEKKRPSLSSFGGGLSEQPDAEVPDYREVSQADD